MNKNQTLNFIEAAIDLAFEAGKWYGQVELEEHMDRFQFSQVAFEAINSRKTTMPLDLPTENRYVRHKLRSEEWRVGVRKSSENYKKRAYEMVRKQIALKDEQLEISFISN